MGVTNPCSRQLLKLSFRGGRYMSFMNILRRVFLSIALGGHSVLGVGMSQEKIEELLRAMNQTMVEAPVSDDESRDLEKPHVR
jgi:hypothetical protein